MSVNRRLERIYELERNLEYYESRNATFEAQATRELISREEDLLILINRPEWRGSNQDIFQKYFLDFMPAAEHCFTFAYIFDYLSFIQNEEKYHQLYYEFYQNEEGLRH